MKLNEAIKKLEEVTGSSVYLLEPTNFISDVTKTSNDSGMQSLNEVSLKRLMGKHYAQAGFVIISASRGATIKKGATKEEEKKADLEQTVINNKNYKSLINDVSALGYSFIPCYGGFIEIDDDKQEREVYEKSLIVVPYDRQGNPLDFNKLSAEMIKLGNKYLQDEILIKRENENPKYIITHERKGTVGEENTELKFSGDFKENDMLETFFTLLKDKKERFSLVNESVFTGVFFNPKPVLYTERMIRSRRGERF